MKTIFNILPTIFGIKTVVYKDGSAYMVDQNLTVFGFTVKTYTYKASDLV